MIKKLLALVLLVGFVGSLAACETTEGFGKDVEKAGDNIKDAARDNK